jgi:hypothetical protein
MAGKFNFRSEGPMQVDLAQNPKAFIVINPVAGVSEAEAVRETI